MNMMMKTVGEREYERDRGRCRDDEEGKAGTGYRKINKSFMTHDNHIFLSSLLFRSRQSV
jgi:hypothetical protein